MAIRERVRSAAHVNTFTTTDSASEYIHELQRCKA